MRELTNAGSRWSAWTGRNPWWRRRGQQASAPVHLASGEALVEARVDIGNQYPLICANFALLHQDIIPLLSALHALLAPDGAC